MPKSKITPTFTVLTKPAVSTLPDDTTEWNDTLLTLAQRKQFVTVSHLCDLHMGGDEDECAVNLAYRLVARKQPDIIVVGSDTADFGVISRFDADPDRSEEIDDELDHFKRYWQPHIDALTTIAPRATLIFISGNHESRVLKYMANNAPKLRKTVERQWADMIRYQGRVLYRGMMDWVDIGALCVQHGNRSGENAAKMLLQDLSFQVSTMAGHVHRIGSYHRPGHRYSVQGITSGCLCSTRPHYAGAAKPRLPMAQGTAFAIVDLRSTHVHFDNIEFKTTADGLVAFTDGQRIEQARGVAAVADKAA